MGQPHTVPILTVVTPPGPLGQPAPPQLQSSSPTSLTITLPVPSALRGNAPSSLSFYVEADTATLGEMAPVDAASTTLTCKHLKPACCYHFRWNVCSPNGNSPLSAMLVAPTAPTVPEPPQNLRVGVLEAIYSPLSFLKVVWDPPFCDNGSEVTRYTVEMAQVKRDSKLAEYTQIATISDTSFLLRDLVAGCSYSIRVQAHNACGSSSMSAPLVAMTGANPPEACDAPMLLKRPTDRVVVVGWSEPTTNGSSIVGYRVMVEPIHREYHLPSSTRSLQIKQLKPSTSYSVVVYAINTVGESEPSEALEVTTEEKGARAPPPPQFEGARVGEEVKENEKEKENENEKEKEKEKEVTLRWEKVTCEDCEVQSYQLFSANRLVYEGTACKYQFNAEVGVHYVFQVRAVNLIGPSSFSDEYDVYIPPPVVVKEVAPKEASNPKAAKKQFANTGNSKVDSVLERKNRKSWIQTWWKENSVLVAVIAIIIGILVLTKATMQ